MIFVSETRRTFGKNFRIFLLPPFPLFSIDIKKAVAAQRQEFTIFPERTWLARRTIIMFPK